MTYVQLRVFIVRIKNINYTTTRNNLLNKNKTINKYWIRYIYQPLEFYVLLAAYKWKPDMQIPDSTLNPRWIKKNCNILTPY